MTIEPSTRPGLLSAIGRACFRHRWIVVAVWLAVAAGGFLASGKVFDGLSNKPGAESLESLQGYDVLSNESQVGGTVIGEVTGADINDPQVRTAVLAAASDIAQTFGVRQVATPFDTPQNASAASGLVANDGSGFLIDVTLGVFRDDRAAENATVASIRQRMDVLKGALQQRAPAVQIAYGGGKVLNAEVNHQVESDLGLAEKLSLPITLVVLIFVFGGVIAAGMPVFAAILSVFGAMAALLGFEQFIDLDQNATIVVTLLGLGLSIDYGLLLIARYREELAHGHAAEAALSRAWSSAGRTILFSALTVAGSLCGLLLFDFTSMTALGIAGVSIATISMTVALTATAALLGFARKRIRPSKHAIAHGDEETGFFATLARLVQRRPISTVVVTGGLLLAAGLPLFATKPSIDDIRSLPTSLPSVRVAHDLADKYGRGISPAVTVVARTDAASLDAWAGRWAGAQDVARVAPAVQVAPTLALVNIYASGDSEDTAARALADRVRADRPAGRSWVTGDAALLNDILRLIANRLPWAIGLTVLAMLVLLFLMTGSIVVPIKAVFMNALSLGATVGVMNLVFQQGFGSGVLHTLTTGGLDPFVIVGVLAFAFGLSMDYEVFLLSRIKEYVDTGIDSDAAVRKGLQRSGRVITSAALCMVIVFGCFLVGRVANTQQIGLGLAAAIAIDATLVRCVLVPATMTLLGRWNWWAPRWLARWHAHSIAPNVVEQTATPEPASA